MRILRTEATEDRFELARLVVLVLDEPDVRRRPDPDAAVADFQPGAEVEGAEPGLLALLADREVFALAEDGALVAEAIAVGVFQNHDAVARGFALGGLTRVFEAFDAPDTTAFVDAEGDGVDELRFAGEELDLELGGHLELGDRLFGFQVRLPGALAVVEAEFLLGERRCDDQQGECEGERAHERTTGVRGDGDDATGK